MSGPAGAAAALLRLRRGAAGEQGGDQRQGEQRPPHGVSGFGSSRRGSIFTTQSPLFMSFT